jgi:hypothetical protein
MQRWQDPNVVVALFADHGDYHAPLVESILARTDDPKITRTYEPADQIGRHKLFDLAGWGVPAATLIHERALTLFRKVFQVDEVHVDLSWASVYGHGDNCLAHSHPRTNASVVYMLEPGDPPTEESGMFMFADPRMPICCREQKGYMSTPCAPILTPGMMIMFPGQAVHCVSTYLGHKPRITLSWNLNLEPVPGEPLRPDARPPGQR